VKPRRITPAAQLRALARDLRRLRPDWRLPERYFENRDEIENRLRDLARELDNPNA
jgi:hypothetical protein